LDPEFWVVPVSQGTRKAMEAAHNEARRLHHNYLGTEHLLTGILITAEGQLLETIQEMNLTPQGLAEATERVIGFGSAVPPSQQQLLPRYREVFKIAQNIAESHGQTAVTPEFVLLAICQASNSVAYAILRSIGQDPQLIARRVQALIA
jgi:ATP-dependent Clp protease ATP-binding subunit ClpC